MKTCPHKGLALITIFLKVCSCGWPGTHYLDQTGLKVIEICLLCLPSAETKGMHHNTQLIMSINLEYLYYKLITILI